MSLQRLPFHYRGAIRSLSIAAQPLTDQTNNVPPTASKCRTTVQNPCAHTAEQHGLFYTVSDDVRKSLFEVYQPTRQARYQAKLFNEMTIMVRNPFLEVRDYIEQYEQDAEKSMALRVLLYGKLGVGKHFTMLHLLHYAYVKNYVIAPFPWLPNLIKRPKEPTFNQSDPQILDSPVEAAVWLKHFRVLNEHHLQNLATTQSYKWSDTEAVGSGEPLLNLINHGIDRIKHSCDCFSGVVDEIKQYTDSGKIRTYVAAAGINAAWHDSYQQRLDNSLVHAQDFSIIRHFKRLLDKNWRNAIIVTTVNESAMPLKHMNLTMREIPDFHPRYLLGKEGFEFMEPFIPVRVSNYTEKEIESCLDYYLEREYIQRPKARTEEARAELKFLSGYNPRELAKMCSWI